MRLKTPKLATKSSAMVKYFTNNHNSQNRYEQYSHVKFSNLTESTSNSRCLA